MKLVGGKQDSKKDDPAPSVGDLSGLPTLSPDSLTTVQQPETIGKQPETIGKQPETIGKQPETGRWVTDSQGDWVWKPGKDDSRPPDLGGNWETSKWMGRSDYWWEWQPVQEGDQLYWKPILQTRIRDCLLYTSRCDGTEPCRLRRFCIHFYGCFFCRRLCRPGKLRGR